MDVSGSKVNSFLVLLVSYPFDCSLHTQLNMNCCYYVKLSAQLSANVWVFQTSAVWANVIITQQRLEPVKVGLWAM